MLTKLKNSSPNAFIDLARLGRTGWRGDAYTFLLLKFIALVFSLSSLIAVNWGYFSEHRPFPTNDANENLLFTVVDAAACIFGLWLACKRILRRPFRSLISVDMMFDIRRCLLGAALYLPVNAIGLLAISCFSSLRAGTWLFPFQRFEWPHHNDQIAASMSMLIAIPMLAFSEELYFRAWLTQTLGRYIRSTTIVVMLVAVAFAAVHSQYDLRMKVLILVNSFGLSALILRDKRLELAIGAHAMWNICATLQTLFFTGPLAHTHTQVTTLDWAILVILKGILPYAVMYGLLQRMGGWFAQSDASAASSSEIQSGCLSG